MRLRHIPGAEKQIEESTFVIQEPEQKKGCWAEVFGNENRSTSRLVWERESF